MTEQEMYEMEEELLITPADAMELAAEAREAGITPLDAYMEMDEDIFGDYEVWLPVVSYEGMEASNLGRVRLNGKIRKGTVAKNGYIRQVFRFGAERKHLYFHRLVLEAFYGPCSGYECDHINCNKSDNFLDNLEYVTRQENIERASEYYGAISDKPVLVLDADDFKVVSLEKNVRMAGRHTHTPSTFVLGAAEGTRKKERNGLIFVFAPDNFKLLLEAPKKAKKRRKSKKNKDEIA